MSDITKRDALEFYAVLAVGVVGIIVAIWFNLTHPHVVVKYDCSISEISPDYPIAVKEQCRQLRAKYFQDSLQKPK